MELIFGILVGLLILVFLVVVHELGHAIVARRNGVVVEEFGIGFPPRAWGKKLKNGILVSLNWLPLGGFVRLQGEHDAADQPGDYGAASFWQKTRILLAGVLINWLVAALLLTVLAWVGLPKILPNQFEGFGDTTTVTKPLEVVSVSEGSPADKAGLETGDQILRFNGARIPSGEALADQTEANAGETARIIYSRDGVEQTASVELRENPREGQGHLGIASGQREALQAGWSAPIVGFGTAAQFTWVTLQGLGNLLVDLVQGVFLQFSPDAEQRKQADESLAAASNSVAGPIGILGVIFPAAEQAGLTQLIFLTAIISLTLAIMNALPIPALDGGRWFTMAAFKLFKKPLTREREEKVQATGFLILLILIILVTVSDVGKFF